MADVIKRTHDEVQAALLNSEQDPHLEIFTAFCAVTAFADGEGITKAQMRVLFESALDRLKEEPPTVEEKPQCFGRVRDSLDRLCTGGPDPTFKDAVGSNLRPQCPFFTSCGEAMPPTPLTRKPHKAKKEAAQ